MDGSFDMDIALTFDYEVFFGKASGTVDNSLLSPTDTILTILAQEKKVCTFFVDASFLLYLNNNGDLTLFNKIANQIGRILSEGHSVELHLHPHWLDAVESSEGEWLFRSYDRFKVSDLGSSASDYIYDCFQTLMRICIRYDSKYQIKSFRAGGWCAQPWNVFEKPFKDLGITIDSSVAVGSSMKTYPFDFDYTACPSNKNWYQFSDDPGSECNYGNFIEVPISSYRLSSIDIVYEKLIRDYFFDSKFWGDGVSYDVKTPTRQRLKSKTKIATTDNTRFEELKRKLPIDGDMFVNFCSHPKLLSNLSITTIDKLVKSDNRFVKIRDVPTSIVESKHGNS